MKRGRMIGVSLIIVMVLLMACSPKAAPAPDPQAPAPAAGAPAAAVPAAPVKPAWEVEWEKTVEAAQQEGKVAIATSMSGLIRAALVEGFKKAYGIRLESISGRGAEVVVKVLAERRAGLYLFDIPMVGSTSVINSLKPAGAIDRFEPALILPEVTDPELIKKVWWQGKLHWLDADRTYLVAFPQPNIPIVINTNLVKEGEIKSLRDLLDPKWRGKLIYSDPRVSGGGANFASFAEDALGWDYVAEFIKAQPMLTRDHRLMHEWLAHGKVAVAVGPDTATFTEFIQAGAPIKGLFPVEGTWLNIGSVNPSIFKHRPNPNAAKVFLNWYLTKEVQTIVSRTGGYESARLDVPADHLPPEQRRGGTKTFMTNEERILAQPKLQAKISELLAPQ